MFEIPDPSKGNYSLKPSVDLRNEVGPATGQSSFTRNAYWITPVIVISAIVLEFLF